MSNTSLKRAAICLFIMLAVVPTRAEATVTSVTVTTSRQYENAAGYTYAEITIHGSVARADGSLGQYSVPAVVIYPKYGRGNRVGVVDWLNSAFYHFFPATTELGTFEFTLLATGSYLFEEGYTYISIQWNKAVTEIFGPTVPDDGQPHNLLVYGSIDRSADAWEILLDAARLLKDPRVYPGGETCASGNGSELRLLAGRGASARVARGGPRSYAGLRWTPRPDDRAHVLEARRRRPELRVLRTMQPVADQRKPCARHRARIRVRHADLPSDGPRPREERVLHSQLGQSQLAPVRDGGDLTSARTNSAARSPEPEHRGRQAHLPRSLRQPDQVDTRQIPREASRRPLLPRDAWTRRMPSSRRWMPMAISREAFDYLTSRRPSTGALPVLHSAATRRSILPGSTRSIRSCSSVAPSLGSATTSCSVATLRAGST